MERKSEVISFRERLFMIVGIVLAAGKGTRMQSKDKNKVTVYFLNKPLVVYSVELMEKVADKTVVVIGAYHESVKEVLKNYRVEYAYQKEQLGTAHAVMVAVKKIEKLHWSPKLALVGYGDHSMFYPQQSIQKMISFHKKEKASITLVTVKHRNDTLHWGFVVRGKNGSILEIVEYKDATEEQKMIQELNAGFYCFDFEFLKEALPKVSPSPVSKEYYLTSLVKIAADQGKKVSSFSLPFSQVGIGVNRWSELEESQRLYLQINQSKTNSNLRGLT